MWRVWARLGCMEVGSVLAHSRNGESGDFDMKINIATVINQITQYYIWYWMELIDFAIWRCPLTLSPHHVWRVFTRFLFQFCLLLAILQFLHLACLMSDGTYASGGRCFQVHKITNAFQWTIFHRGSVSLGIWFLSLSRSIERWWLRKTNQMHSCGASSSFLRIHQLIHVSSEIRLIVFARRIDRFAIRRRNSWNISFLLNMGSFSTFLF